MARGTGKALEDGRDHGGADGGARDGAHRIEDELGGSDFEVGRGGKDRIISVRAAVAEEFRRADIDGAGRREFEEVRCGGVPAVVRKGYVHDSNIRREVDVIILIVGQN